MRSSFLSLPLEIRQRIYDETLTLIAAQETQARCERITPAILMLNSQILHEAQYVLFRKSLRLLLDTTSGRQIFINICPRLLSRLQSLTLFVKPANGQEDRLVGPRVIIGGVLSLNAAFSKLKRVWKLYGHQLRSLEMHYDSQHGVRHMNHCMPSLTRCRFYGIIVDCLLYVCQAAIPEVRFSGTVFEFVIEAERKNMMTHSIQFRRFLEALKVHAK